MSDEQRAEFLEVNRLIDDGDEDTPLAEEIADTATIESLLDEFILEASTTFASVIEVAMEGNPVLTYLELVALGEDTIDAAHTLKRELIAKLANRADVIAEQGSQLRKQVLDDDMDGRGI